MQKQEIICHLGDIQKKNGGKKWVLGRDSFIAKSLMNPKHEAKPLETFEWYQIKHAAISDVSRRFWNFVGLGMGIDKCKCQKQRVFSEGVGPRKDLRSKIMRMLASQRLEIAILFYFQNIYIFGYQWFSKYLQRCLQKTCKIFTQNLQNIYEMFAKMQKLEEIYKIFTEILQNIYKHLQK